MAKMIGTEIQHVPVTWLRKMEKEQTVKHLSTGPPRNAKRTGNQME
jgi:hypothetical protein